MVAKKFDLAVPEFCCIDEEGFSTMKAIFRFQCKEIESSAVLARNPANIVHLKGYAL